MVSVRRERSAIPIDYRKGKGLYYTGVDWRLPTVGLSQGELFALILGARMLEAYSWTAYGMELRRTIIFLKLQLELCYRLGEKNCIKSISRFGIKIIQTWIE